MSDTLIAGICVIIAAFIGAIGAVVAAYVGKEKKIEPPPDKPDRRVLKLHPYESSKPESERKVYWSKQTIVIILVFLLVGIGVALGVRFYLKDKYGNPGQATAPTGKIAFLLPEFSNSRYATQDLPNFKAKLTSLGFDINNNLIYEGAKLDASVQQLQAEDALKNNARVLVLDPVDSAAAAAIADAAAQQNVPVISYDRLITGTQNIKYYISFDNVQVGKLQATALMTALSNVANPTIVMINGSPTDNNAKLLKQGAHSVFDPLVASGKLTIAREYDTPGWLPSQAQTEMTQALTALNNKVDGVYAANDGTAGGAFAAMKAAGITTFPPMTGEDAQIEAIQRILTGEQYMTVYKAIKSEAADAAQIAYDLATNSAVPSIAMTGTTNNGSIDVPSIILPPVAMTKENIETTVIIDGFWKVSDICTPDFATACAAAGIK